MGRQAFRRSKSDGTIDDGTGGGSNFPLKFKRSGYTNGTSASFIPAVPTQASNSFQSDYMFWFARKQGFTPLYSGSGGTLNRFLFYAGNTAATAGTDDWKVGLYSASDEGHPETLISTTMTWTAASAWGNTVISVYATDGSSRITLEPDTWYWVGWLGASTSNGGNADIRGLSASYGAAMQQSGTVNYNNHCYLNQSNRTTLVSSIDLFNGSVNLVHSQHNYTPYLVMEYVITNQKWA
tara:strand:+ start:596 stop:1309 length:714 start_codon:yes stop_codon:yes gene_type:complete